MYQQPNTTCWGKLNAIVKPTEKREIMACATIHLAIVKKYLEKNENRNRSIQ